MEKKEYPGIFKSSEKVFNMDIDTFVVSGFAIENILKVTEIPRERQLEAIDKLVARTPDYLDLEPEDAYGKIKVALTQETVIAYLEHEGQVDTSKRDVMYECGIDQEGSIQLKVFYPNTPRDVRRAIDKQLGEKGKREQQEVIELLGMSDDLIEAATRKLEEKIKTVGAKKKPALRRIK
jgi:hypothetical protein